ncbi:uncharacterized protein [Malus domestica]|uniref:uncharacterized protein isoform X7 n=1 Tax=Malus domestica TaxID=3750 RepID=UPI003976E453
MSKPSLRLQFTKLLVFYHVLLWQLGHWPQSKLHCRADVARLPEDEVSALRDFMSNTELRPEQIIEVTYCSDVVRTYGFVIECNCTNESGCRITGIRMSYLGLTGTIHEKVGDLTSLTYLILSNNTLHGGIPDTIGNLKNLQVLDLSRNQLNGSIPASLGRLVSLEYLYLQYNLLSQGIPPSFGSLTKLTELNLQFNMISDSIPEDFGNLSSLTIMELSENQLSGPLPQSLGNLTTLTTFYVSANNLSGKFPETYGNLTSLKKFSIAGNYISGPLPVETIAKWTNITHLVLVGNNFEGNLTEKIFRLPKLQYLLITDLANNSFPLPPKINNSANFISLTLRNCSINGTIPKYIGENMTSLRYLDLSFNKLTGGLPQNMSSKMIYMSFSRNMLNGTIAPSILGDSQTRIDLSFNYFSAEGSPVQSNQQLNLFACCRNSSTTEPQMMDPFEMKNRYCPENEPEYHSLFINCGGEETIVDGHQYDQDNDTSLFYTSPKKSWAYSLSGDFGVPESNTSNYIKSMTRGVHEAPLYEKARFSPISLEYYVFCLRKGNYIVTLYFKEIVDSKDEDYSSLRKRVFDVYIQDVRRLDYFKIREEEGTTEGPITKKISAVVVNDSGLLNIHLYWPGKGSYQYHPSFNGPLISAISVTPEFDPDKSKGQFVALITLASIVAALPLSLAFAWRMGWLPSEGFPKIETSQEKIVDEYQDSEELPSQEENGDEQRNTKDQGTRKNTEKYQGQEEIGDEHQDNEELPSQEEIGDEHQDNEELPSQEEIGDEHQDNEELPSQEEIGDEPRNTKGQEEVGDEQRNTKDQGRRKNTKTKRKKKEKLGDEHPNIVKKLGMFGLSYGFPLGMSSEELPSQEEIGDKHQDSEEFPSKEEIGDEHQDSEELPSQEEIGDEQRNTKGQQEINDEQRNTKDQGRRKNTETKRKKKEKIGDDHPDTVKKLGMLGLSYGFPSGQEEIGEEHQDSEELPNQEEIGDEHQDREELPSQEEIGDEQRNTKGQEEIGDEQRNTKDQGRRKNTETKRKKKEKIGDERPNTIKKLGMFGLSYGLPLDMSSEELPSKEEIGDEHQDSEELPSQEEIGDEQRNTKDQGRRKNTETKRKKKEKIGDERPNTVKKLGMFGLSYGLPLDMSSEELPSQEEIGDEQRKTKDQGRWKNTETKRKKKEKIGDEHPDTVKKLGMLGLSYGFPLGMSSEELPSEEEIGDEQQDSEELPSQEEIGDEQRNRKGQEEIGEEQRNTKDQGRQKNTETKRKKKEKIGDEHPDTVKKLGMFGLSYGFPLGMSNEELPSQEEIGDEHQDSEELPSQQEIGDEQRNKKGQEEIGDEQRNTKDQGRWKNTETKTKKKEKIGDEHPDTVKKLGMLGLSYGFPLGMSSEELPSEEEIGDEHQDSEELPSQEEIGDEQRNRKGQEEIGDEQRNTKDQGRRKNTETKRKKKEKIGDEHPDTVKKLGMFGLSYGFPLGMSSEELPSQEEIGDEHQDSEKLPSQEEIGDEQRNMKGQEEIGDEQRNTKDQGRRKNTETKMKKKEKIGDEHPDIVKKLGMLGSSYGFPLGMSSEELPSQEEISDEHQDNEELPSQEKIGDEQRNTKGQEEIGDEQRNTKDQGRRKNTKTKMKKKEKIGDEHPDTVKKLGMLGLSYGFPLGMSSEELLSQEEIGDEHQDSEELRSQEEISDEQRNTKGQEEIGDEQINTKDQGRRTNTKTRRKKNEKIGDEHLDAVKELINATENFSDKKKLGHSETFFMAQLPSHTVAVKKLDSAHFKGKIDKLKEEIGIIESLQHNNILKLLHAYIGKDLQFLVYEYMENKSLEDILFGSSTSGTIKLDWNTRVNICLGIAQGLQYLHERVQIVHTNIKSANILLNEKLEAKISDFGFANLYSEEDKVMAIGRETKKGYTAPEYLQTDDLDSKLDVFSFGVVVLEIVSGERNVRNQSKKETEVLLDRAYKANRNGNLKSLVDKNLSTFDEREALIILKLALECTTMGASVRPEMSGVVSVLLGEKSIDEVCSPAKPTGDINVVGSLEELAGISDMAAKPTGDINVVGSLEESAGISDMAESLSPLWGS